MISSLQVEIENGNQEEEVKKTQTESDVSSARFQQG